MKKVSVLMPTHNRLSYLKEAVNSFLQQDYKNAELLICADNCLPETWEYLFTLPTDNIKLLEYNSGGNPMKTLQYLWDNADGDYICQLHDDDIMPTDSISFRMEHIGSADMLYGNAIYFHTGEDTTASVYTGLPDYDKLLKTDYINFTTLIWKNNLPFKFDTELNFQGDWMFKLRCLKELNVKYLPYTVMKYRLHDEQETIKGRATKETEKETELVKQKLKQLYEG